MFLIRALCCLFLFSFASSVFAADYKFENITMDKQYFARDRSTGKAVTGKVIRNKDGKKMREYLFDGGVLLKTISYAPSGTATWETPYKNGSRDGEVIGYHENGSVQWRIPYVAGLAEGIRYEYYNTGEVKSIAVNKTDKQHGKYYEMYKNGSVRFMEDYRDGVLIGGKKNYVSGHTYPPEEMQSPTTYASSNVTQGIAQIKTPKQKKTGGTNPSTVHPTGREQDVVVEAEGLGDTKIAALKNAWSEAVRIAIGMYLTSKTAVIDDAITEEIITHSRGRVNAYEELSSQKDASGWRIVIRARIEKDILQETAEATSQSTLLKISEYEKAPIISDIQKKESAIDMINSLELPKIETFFKTSFSHIFIDGKLNINTTMIVNREVYNNAIVKYLCGVLDQVAISKENKTFENSIIQCNKRGSSTTYKLKISNNELDAMSNRNIYCPDWIHCDFNDVYGEKTKTQVFIEIDNARYVVYKLENDVLELLHKKLDEYRKNNSFIITIETMSDDETLAIEKIPVLVGSIIFNSHTTFGKVVKIYPKVTAYSGGWFFLEKFNFSTPITLSTEEIERITDIKVNFTIGLSYH